MREIWIMIAAAACFLAVKGIYDYINGKKKRLNDARRTFGKLNTEGITYEQLELAKAHFEGYVKNNDAFFIDDITSNDLSLDEIYAVINTTVSQCGAENLYSMLRTPLYEEDKLNKREELISYLKNNSEYTVKLRSILSEIGMNKKLSMYSCLTIFRKANIDSLWNHYLCVLGVVIAAVIIPFKQSVGIVSLIAVLAYNIISYFASKTKLSSYVYGVKNIISLINAGNGFIKLDTPEGFDFTEYKDAISTCVKKLKRLKASAFAVNTNVSGDLASIVMDYINMVFHVDLIQLSFAVKCAEKEPETILELYKRIGELDALISVAGLRYATDRVSVPKVHKGKKKVLKFKDAVHPMLSDPVPVSLEADSSILITGSNASGKSTFLKTVAINAILAQTVHTVFAKEYETTYYRIYSSMALTDNIVAGESYYITEIKALKRIMDDVSETPVLCFIDEVLRGTNTVERIAASTAALDELSNENKMVFAATHDIELTKLLDKSFINYHFEEGLSENGDIYFDYVLKEGASQTKNAILMLKAFGYKDEITYRASALAERFTKTGSWE